MLTKKRTSLELLATRGIPFNTKFLPHQEMMTIVDGEFIQLVFIKNFVLSKNVDVSGNTKRLHFRASFLLQIVSSATVVQSTIFFRVRTESRKHGGSCGAGGRGFLVDFSSVKSD
jgi:hypothetical protein